MTAGPGLHCVDPWVLMVGSWQACWAASGQEIYQTFLSTAE